MEDYPHIDFDSLASLTLILACVFAFLFFANRDLFPIAQREPLLGLAASLNYAFSNALWLFELNHDDIPCWLDTFTVQICCGVVLVTYLVRCVKLYMDAGLAQERVNRKPGWFVNHRHYRSKRSLLKIAGVMMGFHFILFIVAIIATGDGNTLPATQCGNATNGIMLAGSAVVYLCFFVGFSIKLAKISDGFYLKSELRGVGCGSGLLTLFWIVMIAMEWDCFFYGCGTLLLWLAYACMFICAIVYPVTIAAMKNPRFRVFSWFRKSSRELSTLSKLSQASHTSTEEFSDYHVDDNRDIVLSTSQPENLPPLSPVQLARLKKVNLAKFLTYPIGREAFRAFTVREFSVENLLFVEEVAKYKVLEQQTKEQARQIFDQFVSDKSPNQVNLPAAIVKTLTTQLESDEPILNLKNIFNDCEVHVMKLMQRDAFRRFQQTAEWQRHVRVFVKETDKGDKEGRSRSVTPDAQGLSLAPSTLPLSSEPRGHKESIDDMQSEDSSVHGGGIRGVFMDIPGHRPMQSSADLTPVSGDFTHKFPLHPELRSDVSDSGV